MMAVLYVAAGGALGAVMRYFAGKAATSLMGHGFPYATLGVNIIGSLMMGAFIGWMAGRSAAGGQALHLFVAIGVLGGFTTFSSFSLDAVTLFQRGEILSAGAYVLGSVLLSILALFAGLILMRGT